MSYSQYMISSKANVDTDVIRVRFYRLHEDMRDVMCDSLQPDWVACDDFQIDICEVHTEHIHNEHRSTVGTFVWDEEEKTMGRELHIHTTSKQVANYIWYLTKNGATFDTIKEMHEAKQF